MFHSCNVCLHRPGQALRVHHRSVVSGLLQTAAHPVGTRSGDCLDAAHSQGMGDGPLHTPGPGCSAVHMQQAAVWVPDRVCIRSSPPVSLHQHGICLATPSDHFRLPPQGALARPDVGPLFGHAESFQRATTPANGASSLMSFPHGSRVNDGIDPVPLLPGIHNSGRSRGPHCKARPWGSPREGGHRVRIQAHTSAPTGPPPSGNAVGRSVIHRPYAAVWAPFGPQDIQRSRRRPELAPAPVGNSPIRHYMDDFIIIASPHSSQCRE